MSHGSPGGCSESLRCVKRPSLLWHVAGWCKEGVTLLLWRETLRPHARFHVSGSPRGRKRPPSLSRSRACLAWPLWNWSWTEVTTGCENFQTWLSCICFLRPVSLLSWFTAWCETRSWWCWGVSAARRRSDEQGPVWLMCLSSGAETHSC